MMVERWSQRLLALWLSLCAPAALAASVPWWQSAVVYQIYPRSFQDSNGDGVGDVRGIARRLDYLQTLGVDAIWISPFYRSPMRDFGYDVSDFTAVDPLFGTLADVTDLIAAVHRRGMRLILDFVPNHTSDLHPWFQESRASRSSAKRDWYIWRAPKADGGPPTNWLSEFGGSAWQLDSATGDYYYHAFLPQQPDLNWRNPAVADAMLAAMRFWLMRGVDGFRIDAPAHLVEAQDGRDEPPNPQYRAQMPNFDKLNHIYTYDQPGTHTQMQAMRRLTDSFPGERVLIPETDLPYPQQIAYYGSAAAPEAQLPFNFHLMQTAWRADSVAATVRDYEQALPPGDWPNWVLGNHDQPRLASRIGIAQARVAAMLLLTLRGTPTLYYGDELGLRDIAVAPADVQDPAEKREPGKGRNRDPERSPMPWDTSANAGFTTGKPWLPLNPDAASVNVASETADKRSILSFYRALLQLRHGHAALQTGRFQQLASPAGVFVYERQQGSERLVVALNFTGQDQQLPLPRACTRLLLGTTQQQSPDALAATLRLEANAGLILGGCAP